MIRRVKSTVILNNGHSNSCDEQLNCMMSHASKRSCCSVLLSWLGVVPLLPVLAMAQEDVPAAKPPQAIAQLLILKSPITDEALGAVRRTALELQATATKEGRQAILILELTPGASQFHHVYALAEFLAAEPTRNLTTVAWIPESVSGANVLVALACQEIVMHPDATLGDLGRGEALPLDQQTIIKGIVAKRRNKKVNESLVTGLLDPAVTIFQLTLDQGDGVKEKRLATEHEARQLREQGVVIADSHTLKEGGTAWKISGAQAREEDILAMRTAGSRRDVIDAYGLPLEAMRDQMPGDRVEKVAYIELKDEIDALFYSFAQRQIDRAVQLGVKLIIFEIDSPGGSLMYSRDLAFLIADLENREIKSVAYIPDKAYSGGTIVALGCDEIYMRSDATLGDAIPIVFAEGQFINADGKVLSVETEMLRELGERKHRPAAILEAIADSELEVYEVTHRTTGRVWYMSETEIHETGDEWLQGPLVHESRKGVAITVSGRRAAELKIAEPPVADVDELRERLGIPLDLAFKRIERNWVDTTVFVLNNNWVTGFLFFIAVIGLYLELHTMTGFFGICSVVAFSLFFWSKVMGGTAGGLEIVLFLIGAGCLAMEIFVIPGFGVFGISGILLVLASLVMAGQSFSMVTAEYDLMQAGRSIAMFAASLVAVLFTGVALSHFLPRIPFLKDMILAPPGLAGASGPRLRPDAEQSGHPLMGQQGPAVTVLRPAGKARLSGQLVDVVSDGPFIAEGSSIQVVRISGNRIVVRQVES